MTVDRAIQVLYPRKFPFLLKKSNLTIITILLCLSSAIFVSAHFTRYFVYSTTTIVNSTKIIRSVTACTSQPVFASWIGFHSIVMRLSTVIVMLILNMMIVYALIKSKKNLHGGKRDPNSRSTRNTPSLSREYIFAFSLISMNMIYFVFMMPYSIMLIIVTVTKYSQYFVYVINIFAFTTWGPLTYKCLHFPISLAFNKLFRKELYAMMFCKASNYDMSTHRSSNSRPPTNRRATIGK